MPLLCKIVLLQTTFSFCGKLNLHFAAKRFRILQQNKKRGFTGILIRILEKNTSFGNLSKLS